MRFLKLTLILRDEAWRVRRGRHTGCWDQGSNCPFCGLVFHLGCATRCRQHLRAHIFLFTLLWSCLLTGPRAVHFTAVGLAYVAKAVAGAGAHTDNLGFLFVLWVFLCIYFCFLPSFLSSHLQFCSLHLLKVAES